MVLPDWRYDPRNYMAPVTGFGKSRFELDTSRKEVGVRACARLSANEDRECEL